MEYIFQLSVILLVSVLGEVCHALIPLPVPASIYGLCLMLLALCIGVIRLEWVKKTANFLLSIMSVMFIPSIVGLMPLWGQLKPMLLPVLLAGTVGTAVTMGLTGCATQAVLRRSTRREVRK